jgi:hypothetical protein
MKFFKLNKRLWTLNFNKNLKGKVYTLNDDKGTKQLLIRDKKGTYILSSYLDDVSKGIKIY